MKRIRRLPDRPPGLQDYLEVETRRASWEGFRSHDGGRAHRGLIPELTDCQHGLCGYCEISLTELDHQVEHVVPRSDPVQGPSLALDYRNLIACCKGGTRRGSEDSRYREPVRRNRSCGEKKGARMIPTFLEPRNLPALPSLLRVFDDGRIEADSAACTSMGVSPEDVNRTIEMVNLNARRLREARERHWRALNDEWGAWTERLADGDHLHEAARRELLPDRGRLPQFFTTARSYFGPVAERVLREAPREWL